MVRARLCRRFFCGKTSGRVRRCGVGKDNASCGWLHLIRGASRPTLSASSKSHTPCRSSARFGRRLHLRFIPHRGRLIPPPSRGRLFAVDYPNGFPLRGSSAERVTPNPLVSPQRNGVPPRAQPHKLSAGPDGYAVWAREARRKRERRPPGRACSQPWNPLSFSISLPNQPNQRLVFGWVLGRGFCLKSRLPNVSPIYFTSKAYTPTHSLPQLSSKRTSTRFAPSGSTTRISAS